MLSLLSIQQPQSPAEIASHMAYTGTDIGAVALQSLISKGWVEESRERAQSLQLTAQGNEAILHVLARDMRHLEAALEAIRRWRYVPAKRGDEPIPYWYVQPLDFQLDS